MISIQNKFLFIHVPKTGGNSIQNILSNYSEDERVILAKHQDGIERFEVRNKKYDITKHSTLSHYKSVLDSKTYLTLFKFATIRNPWDRMISFYFSPHRGTVEWNRNDFLHLVQNAHPLRQYIREKTDTDNGPEQSGPNAANYRGVADDIDFLMRFERLNEDFKWVCEHINIPYSPLPKRNRSEHQHYSSYYDDELKEIVRQKFSEEITFGNYSFENAH